MWDHVKRAARRVATAFNRPARARIEPPITSHGHVQITAARSKRLGESITKLDLVNRRALRRAGNMPAATVKNYLTVHQTLVRGRFSDA